jgi:hypothetical protein
MEQNFVGLAAKFQKACSRTGPVHQLNLEVTLLGLESMPHFIIDLYTHTSAFDNTINPLTPLA